MYKPPIYSLRPALTALLLATLGPAAIAQSMDELEARLFDHPTLDAMRYGSDAARERAQAAPPGSDRADADHAPPERHEEGLLDIGRARRRE